MGRRRLGHYPDQLRPQAQANADTGGDAIIYSYTITNGHSVVCAYTFSGASYDTYAHAYVGSDSYTDSYAIAHTYTDSNTYTYAYANPIADTDTHPDSDIRGSLRG